MDLMKVAFQILMMLGIASIGLWLRHRDHMSPPVIKGVNTIVLRVAWPAMVLMAVQKERSPEELASFTSILVWGFIVMSLSGLMFYLIGRALLPEKRASVFAALSSMPNAGFVGLPIVQALYGEQGILLLSAFIIAFSTTQWTVGMAIFTGKNFKLRDALLNPGVISAAVALFMFYLDIKLPEPFRSICVQLGGLTTPLAMLLAGARLYELRLKSLADVSLWAAVISRLLLIPLAAFFLLKALGLSGMVLNILLLGLAMPSAASGQMFAERYEKDSVQAALGVSLSLLLCLVTIPLLMGLLAQ